jgi:putative hydrolase
VSPASNQQVADKLRECADLLEQQAASPFRVQAYRRAAETVAATPEDLFAILQRAGRAGLEALPGVGAGIGAGLEELLRTGRWSTLQRLRGALEPAQLFQAVPGVGPTLARRLHDHLQVDTLEALEVAAHDGRLDAVPGLGPRRSSIIRNGLAALLARPRPLRAGAPEPPVEVLLDVDAEYRRLAAAGTLPKIAPRRFNLAAVAWLPVLHAERGAWELTALYSNTARAHDLGTVRDWVVIYFKRPGEMEGQRTVVTETRGPLIGRRVVRGRESECTERTFEHKRAS